MASTKMSALLATFGAFPAKASLQLLGLSLLYQVLLQTLSGNVYNLSQTLSVDDATAILTCLNQSNIQPQTSPYYTTDVWLGQRGYAVTNYSIITDDGYILKVFRIISSPNYVDNGSVKPPVLINHGLAGTSNQWLVQDGQNNLLAVLADQGYDVWVGNCRGNSYSDKHVNLTVNNIKFWDFSFHEMGVRDVPAVIDRILLETQQTQTYYVGYSMGTTQYMILLSERPDYNAKIKAGFLIAPAGVVNDSTTILKTGANLMALSYNENYLYDPILGGRVNTNNAFQQYLGANGGYACSVSSLSNCAICNNAMFAIFGFDTAEMNYTALPSFYTNYADVIGTKCIVHYAQLSRDPQGRFRNFDYGPTQNMVKYNSTNPPEYNLTKITANTVMYYGKGDNLCPPQDVEALAAKFSPGVIKQLNLVDRNNPQSQWNHLDPVVGIHDNSFIFSGIRNYMNSERSMWG